ncbi:uncharacterized protein G2W53_041503 [Senna tora]|uniref:Uncharacterized protein n=1 Tax=Senna tora TaxID=362788 RepID=A0A834SFL6_9FABA|nr:uncharacterized protein G2W53_041503 [Senna tora]
MAASSSSSSSSPSASVILSGSSSSGAATTKTSVFLALQAKPPLSSWTGEITCCLEQLNQASNLTLQASANVAQRDESPNQNNSAGQNNSGNSPWRGSRGGGNSNFRGRGSRSHGGGGGRRGGNNRGNRPFCGLCERSGFLDKKTNLVDHNCIIPWLVKPRPTSGECVNITSNHDPQYSVSRGSREEERGVSSASSTDTSPASSSSPHGSKSNFSRDTQLSESRDHISNTASSIGPSSHDTVNVESIGPVQSRLGNDPTGVLRMLKAMSHCSFFDPRS